MGEHTKKEASRINLALSPENYEYVRIMSKAAGKTMTRFIDDLIGADRGDHAELYEKAKAIVERIHSEILH